MLFHSEQQRKTLGVPSEGFSTSIGGGNIASISYVALWFYNFVSYI